jgi:hypothetical protein
MRRREFSIAAFATIASLMTIAASADPTGTAQSDSLTIPQQEQDFIDIIANARNRFEHAASMQERANVRLGLQNDMLRFVNKGLDATNWVGILQDKGALKDGSIWLVIEVGEKIELMTLRSLEADPTRITIISPWSDVFNSAKHARIGQRVRFSGSVLHSVIESDEEMVQTPRFYIQLKEIESLL